MILPLTIVAHLEEAETIAVVELEPRTPTETMAVVKPELEPNIATERTAVAEIEPGTMIETAEIEPRTTIETIAAAEVQTLSRVVANKVARIAMLMIAIRLGRQGAPIATLVREIKPLASLIERRIQIGKNDCAVRVAMQAEVVAGVLSVVRMKLQN